MFGIAQLPTLLAADNRLLKFEWPELGLERYNISPLLLLLIALVAIAFGLGTAFARGVRMRDYGWKVGVILTAWFVSVAIVLFGQYKLGVDLQGGAILVYGVDLEQTAALNPEGKANDWTMPDLTRVLGRRLNPDGLKEIVIREFGPQQVEIVVPEVDEREIANIERIITTGGALQFMIVATDRDDATLFEQARDQAEKSAFKLDREVKDEQGQRIGYWARVGREEGGPKTPFRDTSVVYGLLRNSSNGKIIDLSPQEQNLFANSHADFQQYLDDRKIGDIDALMVYNPELDIRGEDLQYARMGRDEALRPCIDFGMRNEGIYKMTNLTNENIQRKLAIIFDNTLLSAPVIQSRISENGQITGRFSIEEVEFIIGILKSGSMPVVLHKNPISKNTIGSILGRDTIVKGSYSVIGALTVVLIFMVIYYRFMGLIASLALVLNLLLTVAIMIVLRAPFTLPGLAGLVLTVGMSIDANVLIFERIREELARGAALRMAIRNGFDRALSAIIDGNLTTLLTAIVLYAIGTDQVRGFGITLMLGNITSLFTAIFCARVVFDIGERTRWMKSVSMTRFLTNPQIDWCGWFVPATVASVILIGIGLAATVARGRGILDIDLAGGTSVSFILKQPLEDAEVRKRVDAVLSKEIDPATNTRVDRNVYEIEMQGEQKKTGYKVDSSLGDVEKLKQLVREAFKSPDGKDGLKTFQMSFGDLNETIETPPARPAAGPQIGAPATNTAPATKASATPAGPVPPSKSATDESPEKAADETGKTPPEPSSCQVEQPDAAASPEAPATDAKTSPDDKASDAKAADEKPATDARGETAIPPSPAPGTSQPTPAPAPSRTLATTTAVLRFPGSAITADALEGHIVASSQAAIQEVPLLELTNPKWDGRDNSKFEEWTVKLNMAKEDAQRVLSHLQTDLQDEVIWQTSSKIGGQVSADTRWKAVTAIAISLLGIVAYIWFRFQKVIWGIAAVVALAHDTLVMLGGIAVSYWLVDYLGFMQIEEFKISLPVVAAFLTLIGYSVNDTIVIFDRIREIRGKSPDLTAKIINDSVNQTLSRTIITAGITLMVVVVLYFFGGPGIHAFAFSLVIGVISGSYSTVFIAAPLLLWLLGKREPGAAAARAPVKVPA